jgi:hypothetical protein
MTSSDWAAWVQAIGSILAICAAFLIASFQSRHAQRLNLDRLADHVGALARLMTASADALREFRRTCEGPAANREPERPYWNARSTFKDLADSIKRVNLSEAPSEAIVQAVLVARQAIAKVETPLNMHPQFRSTSSQAFADLVQCA